MIKSNQIICSPFSFVWFRNVSARTFFCFKYHMLNGDIAFLFASIMCAECVCLFVAFVCLLAPPESLVMICFRDLQLRANYETQQHTNNAVEVPRNLTMGNVYRLKIALQMQTGLHAPAQLHRADQEQCKNKHSSHLRSVPL